MNQDLITIGKRAQIAANKLALMNTATKNKALLQLADDLIKNKNQIIAANQQDLVAATQMPTKFTDRLMVNSQRIADMANGLRTIADLNDPTSQIDKGWITKDGLQILQRRVPLGVIGIIFEARPNVAVDATGLTFKSGNAVILRGGKEAIQTNTALVKILRESLQSQHLPVDAVQLITDTSHAIADEMMNLTDYIDVLIPRGGQALIQRVVTTATVPVIETGAGNCHIYIDKDADLTMATNITVNAKVQRPSVCNAAEKLLIHRDIAAEFLPVIAKALMEHGVQLRGDEMACQLVSTIRPVTEEDWETEYNDLIMAVKLLIPLMMQLTILITIVLTIQNQLLQTTLPGDATSNKPLILPVFMLMPLRGLLMGRIWLWR